MRSIVSSSPEAAINNTISIDEITSTAAADGAEMTATSEIKQEPDQEPGPAWQFGQSGVINLDSDADDDDFLAPLPSVRPPTTAAQPTTEAAESTELIETPASPPASTGGLNLGRSLFSKHNGTDQAVGHDQDEHAASDRRREAMLKAQMIWAPKLRAQMQARQQQQVSGGGSTEDEPAELPHPHSKNLKGKESDPGGFKRLEARHIWMQKNNKMTLAAEIEFMKAEAAEAARVSKLEADEAFDRTPEPEPSEGIFLSEDEQPAGHELPSFSELYSDDESEKVSRPRRRKRALDGDEEAPAAKRGRVKGAKKARRNAVADTDYTEEDVHDILRSAKSANVGGRKKGAPKGKTGASRRGGPQMTNLSNMVSSNVFEDSAKTKELPSQPLFQRAGGERQAQLKALIASIPTETDKKAAMADKRYLDEAIKSFTGQGSVRPAADGNWTVKGMASTIKHYQILGVAFMRRREADRVVSGGILADAMGLGKTIMMLTNITNGRAKPGAKHKATLIVASPALLTQWASEIEKHCVSASDNKQHGIGRVIRHDARGRVNSNDSIAILESADIVLTTYHEVCRSYPKADIPPSKTTAAQKDEWWREYYEQNKGILHRCRFHRIVLDECQAIKNHRGQTSMACRAIDSKHHWAISGTPVQNTVREFYPYFKFLREPHTGSYKIFKENFCSPGDPEGSEKLAVFLRKLMIRRTHLDTLFNARLLDLPTPEEHTVWLEFDSVERQIYEIIKKRFIQRINTIAKQGNLEKQESHIWTMLLRLRQCCGHILLTQGTIFDLLEREDFERLNKLCEKEDEMSDEGASLLVHLRQVLKSHRNVKTIQGGIQGAVISEYETAAVDVKNVDETMDQTGGKFGLSYKFGKYLESISSSDHWGAITQRCLCTGCRQTPKDPQITSCCESSRPSPFLLSTDTNSDSSPHLLPSLPHRPPAPCRAPRPRLRPLLRVRRSLHIDRTVQGSRALRAPRGHRLPRFRRTMHQSRKEGQEKVRRWRRLDQHERRSPTLSEDPRSQGTGSQLARGRPDREDHHLHDFHAHGPDPRARVSRGALGLCQVHGRNVA